MARNGVQKLEFLANRMSRFKGSGGGPGPQIASLEVHEKTVCQLLVTRTPAMYTRTHVGLCEGVGSRARMR